jgi:N-methylhydantoinase A
MPVRLVLSGPSTGVVGAAAITSEAGSPNIITFDMGGTSSDVSLVQDGEPKVTAGMELDGRPIRSPMLDIHTVGAGGGSIAWIDSGNHLKVGPASAGAFPGPACYGNGQEATVTDANVVLQVLNPEYLLDGQLKIDAQASHRAVKAIADPLGLTVPEAAQGIIRVVTANMARAIRVISVQRGYDPRDYVLVPFGGAGPLHASRLAIELGITRIIVPETPGAQSALGLLMTDIRSDFMRTQITRVAVHDAARSASELSKVFTELTDQAIAWFDEEGIEPERRSVQRRLEMRYAGQNYELPVDVPEGPITGETIAALVEGFQHAHDRMYGYSARDEVVEAVTFRVQAIADVPRAAISRAAAQGRKVEDAVVGLRDVYLAEHNDYVSCPVYDRRLLDVGHHLVGPAVIAQMDTTTLLLPSDVCAVDDTRNLVIDIRRTPNE